MNLKRALLRRIAVRGRGVTLARDVHIGPGTVISTPTSLDIGSGTYIGKFCTIQVSGTIGRGVLIANSVGIVGSADHLLSDVGVPVRFARWIGDSDYPSELMDRARVFVGDDVWIGYGAVLVSPVTVGAGSVVAAGSVVRGTIPPNTVVSGSPAAPIRTRFSDTQWVEHQRALKRWWSDYS